MKKLLLLLALILHLSLSATAAVGDTFTVNNLKYQVLSETGRTVELTGFETDPSGVLTIPASVTNTNKQYDVISIGESAFENCVRLTSVIIPESLKEIKAHVFSKCRGLTSVTIPNSVKKIGSSAFYGCSSLASVNIPESVREIEPSTFSDCSSLLSVTIPTSIWRIDIAAFYRCSSLSSVTIPNSVSTIGNYAFQDCSSLTSVTIPNSVISIHDKAFQGCSSLTSVTIPNSVTSIYDRAFQGCSSLISVTIPESVTKLLGGVFSGCTSLTDISVDSENKTYCSLDGVVYTKNMQTIHTVPAGKKGAFEIPSSVKDIEAYAFSDCSNLTSVTIPNSVTKIGNSAFSACGGLTSVAIPNSVTLIALGAFSACSNIETIYLLPATPPRSSSSPFEGVPAYATVYVPKGTIEAYFAAFTWLFYFTDIREMGALAVSLSRSSLALGVGESDTLEATVEKDDDVTVESESWTTSKPEVATVENGHVTAVGEGTATITCTIVDGYGLTHTASCEVTVSATTGIANIEADCAPAEYYTLSGLRVAPDTLTPGLYIKRQGPAAIKIIIK